MDRKKCTLCLRKKPTDEFYSFGWSSDGLRSACKKCYNKQDWLARKRRRENKNKQFAIDQAELKSPGITEANTYALSLALKDFRIRPRIELPIRKVDALSKIPGGLIIYRSPKGLELIEAKTPRGTYTLNLGLFTLDDLAEFFTRHETEVLYE